jgi:orotate phosphoribosyltransferase
MSTANDSSNEDLPEMPDPGGRGASSAGDQPPEPPNPSRSTRLPPVAPPEGAEPGDIDARRALAGDLLHIGAVSLSPDEPFTWSSGMASPIYCDNRMTLGFPRIRSAICDGLHHIATGETDEIDVIAGTATAGIPHAAWLADRLGLPMAYVRGAAKSHGQKNRIEGIVKPGDRVLLVEDLISTGGSALSAVNALEEAGAVVVSVCAIFTYELDIAAEAFADTDVFLHTLTDFSTLLDVARREHDLCEADIESLEEWRRDPQAWSTAHGGA